MSAIKLPIVCPVAGVSFVQDEVNKVRPGHRVSVERDLDNPHDPFACKVSRKGLHIGYIPRTIAKRLCESRALCWEGVVTDVLKGDKFTGLRVRIVRGTDTAAAKDPGTQTAQVSKVDAGPAVYARSGRHLGTFVLLDGNKVIVETALGVKVPYPQDLVTYDLRIPV